MTTRLTVLEEGEAGQPDVAAGPAAPPWPHLPTVEWQVCGTCNYDCSYCIQSPVHRQGQPSAVEVDRMLAFLGALPGRWQVKMTGGEPFASRHLLDRIVPGLMATRHRIALLTNLSPAAATLERFARLSHGRLDLVSASLHLEHTTTESFLDRLRSLRAAAHPDTRFVVNAVLVPGRLPAVHAARDAVRAAGFRFFPQLMKANGGLHPYRPDEIAAIDEIVGGLAEAERLRSANVAPAYQGRRCWSGARYLVLTQTGDAWSCRSAKREGEGFLGNVHAGGVSLRPGPVACSYAICPCAVPANRGMIEGLPARELDSAAGEPA